MTNLEIFDEQDQRYVQATSFDRSGNPIAAIDERGVASIGKDNTDYLWWLKMMEVFKIPILPRVFRKIYIKWKHPKIIGGE